MRTLLSIVVIILQTSLSVLGQTYFSGGIYESTIWDEAGSPYIITGNVTVFPTKTLVLLEGAEVRFDGNYTLEVRGMLNSLGTAEKNVVITSNKTEPQRGSWHGIVIKNKQGGKANYEYTNISYAKYVNSVECCSEGGPVTFTNCKFDNNYCVLHDYATLKVFVDNCEFTNNSRAVNTAYMSIYNSTFINNDFGFYETEDVDAIACRFEGNGTALHGRRGTIAFCTITNNGKGVDFWYEGFRILKSHITHNGVGIRIGSYTDYALPIEHNRICYNDVNVMHGGDRTFELRSNCWCTSDKEEIESKLYDGYDDVRFGLFNYDIFSDNCETHIESVVKVWTGLNDQKTSLNSIYPNPFNSTLTIDLENVYHKLILIQIFNLVGQEMYSTMEHGSAISLALEFLDPGIYNCRISVEGVSLNKKVIKL